MSRRFISIWFPRLLPDWHVQRQSALADKSFAICAAERGREYAVAISRVAEAEGIRVGMALADAKALVPDLIKIDHDAAIVPRLLGHMADWCLRYTPLTSVDGQDGLWLEVTGCTHLFGGETALLRDLLTHLRGFGYETRAALADTPGAAWAVARYGRQSSIIPVGSNRAALAPLPPAALRLPPDIVDKLQQVGIRTIQALQALPRATLARRFGLDVCQRLDQALGDAPEPISPRQPVAPYAERLASPEPILTAEGIAHALQKLLDRLCVRLSAEGKGLRRARFHVFRVDGHVEILTIGTSSPARRPSHLFRLFHERLAGIDPGLGLELFILDAPVTELITPAQNGLLAHEADPAVFAELTDRLMARLGADAVYSFRPIDSHWPTRAVEKTAPLEKIAFWPSGPSRPLHLVSPPEPIEVTAPVPDYPPMQFRHHGTLHRIARAEGPERIEGEWWRQGYEARDYYRLEDEAGHRYWVFRAGATDWFLHGHFA